MIIPLILLAIWPPFWYFELLVIKVCICASADDVENMLKILHIAGISKRAPFPIQIRFPEQDLHIFKVN